MKHAPAAMASISNVSILRLLFAIAISAVTCFDIEYKDITFIVISQPNPYHVKRAELFKEDLIQQFAVLNLKETDQPQLHLLHETEGLPSKVGHWTLFPVFSAFSEVFKITQWTFICEDETRVKLPLLLEILKKYDPSENLFLGRGLHDSSATIIHHFYSHENPAAFLYPDYRAGFLLSHPLVESLSEKLTDLQSAELEHADFSIDAKHEFAKYLLEKLKTPLTHVPQLCVLDSDDCVTHDVMRFPKCGPAIPNDDLAVAVKTCEKFHKERIPYILKTWGQETKNIEYFSETEDSSIPTIDLGVPNTERGHCGKTMAIIKRAVKEQTGRKWLLIADDDTIISLSKLRLLLACYDASEPAAIGERYGYLASRGNGYDYITGGGGMIFSWPMLKILAETCSCPSDDSPDDMILGMCLKHAGIAITHTPYIHQARIADYSSEFLKHRSHVSFHKHWELDPLKTYEILQEDHKTLHDEL